MKSTLPMMSYGRKRTGIREDFLKMALNIARQLNNEPMSDAQCNKVFKDLPTINMKKKHG